MDDEIRMRLESSDIAGERISALKELFPEVFAEGRIDFEKLRLALGDHVETGRERYGLTWAGKADAMRAVQVPSTATLVPMPGESVDWDTTQNVFIEGENLEVLKLLQKSYQSKVKMIYIDPPYNTGNDFIYSDDYRDSLGNYLRLTGQVSGEGHKLTSNPETGGRYHSNWLNMMYPRLFLARNLLREDGVIFVSIDDHEIENLRCVMDEIFGEENFVATVIWNKVFASKNSTQYFSENHDYILVYSRVAGYWRRRLLPRSAEQTEDYQNPDSDLRGPWNSVSLSARNPYRDGLWSVTAPGGRFIDGPPKGSYWKVSFKKFQELDNDHRIWWGKDRNGIPRRKVFLSEVQAGVVPQTIWGYDEVGNTQEAKKSLLEFVPFDETENVLNSVKPPRLIQRMLQLSTVPSAGETVLDFFSGSAPTAHAVILQNGADGGNRRYICVQFPEPLPKAEANLRTIADIGTARIRSVGREASGDQSKLNFDTLPDVGFRCYRLNTSNFKIWNADVRLASREAVAEQLTLHIDHVLPDRSQQDILFEILLKAGYPLTADIQQVKLGDQSAFSISAGNLVVCLESSIAAETLRAAAALDPKPIQVICLDHAFEGNDQLKTNVVLEMESHGIQFRTV